VHNCEADPVAAENLREGLVVCGWEAGGVTVEEGLGSGMELGAWRISVMIRGHSSGLVLWRAPYLLT